MKKILSVFLALMLCISVAVPVLAEYSVNSSDSVTAPMTSAEVLEVMDEYGRDVVIEIAEQETPLSSSDLVVQPTSTYTMHSTAASQPGSVTAAVSDQGLHVNKRRIANCEHYNINGYNYFKLRDIACLLRKTSSKFSVEWDSQANAIRIETGGDYVKVGGELKYSGFQSQTAYPSTQRLIIDGVEITTISAYNVNGNNYFKLRDLGKALYFFVGYNPVYREALVVTSDWLDDPVVAGLIPYLDLEINDSSLEADIPREDTYGGHQDEPKDNGQPEYDPDDPYAEWGDVSTIEFEGDPPDPDEMNKIQIIG